MAFDLELLKTYLNEQDRFCKCSNIRLTEIREGYAEAVLEVEEKHLNGLNVVQGGAIYTLCDLAFAGAANSRGVKAIGMNASVHPPRNCASCAGGGDGNQPREKNGHLQCGRLQSGGQTSGPLHHDRFHSRGGV